jgi:CheY-like chemotaxis protein
MRLDESHRPPVDVLIADDDPMLRGSVRSFLEMQGFRCAEAADGSQALQASRDLRPRCVLLDLNMPGVDGLTVARHLRADPRTRDIRLHCLTGHTEPANRGRAAELGCVSFLVKPVNPEVILDAVARRPAAADRAPWTGLTKSAAEELLDWLQANHYPPAEVDYEEGRGFSIRLKPAMPGP